jgi:Na+(H+)/acetate symporter ActP
MSGLSDLLKSERGVFCIIALVISAVLVVLGHMTTDAWVSFIQYLTTVLVASKTITTAVELAKKPSTPPAAEVVKE